jgi:serine/threonine protein phosphatase PrpC
MSLTLQATVVTDPGLIRSNNEDSAYAGSRLIVVADGMGGLPAGELASDIVISALRDLETVDKTDDPLLDLRTAVRAGNLEIKKSADADEDRYGMGTTCTAMLLRDDQLAMVHVGDSRAYLFRDGVLTQVTVDDTYVQMLVEAGELEASEVRYHPQRSLVTQALQGGPYEAHASLADPLPGDLLLICSDGLTDVITDETIAQVFETCPMPQEAAERLVKLTLAAGAPDNVTVVIAVVVAAVEGAEAPTRVIEELIDLDAPTVVI